MQLITQWDRDLEKINHPMLYYVSIELVLAVLGLICYTENWKNGPSLNTKYYKTLKNTIDQQQKRWLWLT